MTTVAVIVRGPAEDLRVGGLSIIDRLALAARSAGCSEVRVIGRGAPPALVRSRERHVPLSFADEVAETEIETADVLVMSASLIASSDDLRRVIEAAGRLAEPDGTPLPAGCLSRFRQDGWLRDLDSLEPVPAERLACAVRDRVDVPRAEKLLWRSLESSADGLVDRYVNRPVARPLTKLLSRTSVSPNLITLVATAVGLLSAWLFSRGDYIEGLLGALVFQLSAIVDCIDGDIARVGFKESRLGHWLDLGSDQLVHVAIFFGLGAGAASTRPETPGYLLAASAAAGSLVALGVVIRARRRPDSSAARGVRNLLDATANRDFSVILIAFAAAGGLHLFLWAAAIGAHVYWIAALAGTQIARRHKRRVPSPPAEPAEPSELRR